MKPITPKYLEDRLREKGKSISIAMRMIEAQLVAARTSAVYNQSACISAVALEQFRDARHHNNRRIKHEERIESLDKILYKLKRDRANIGKSIQQLVAFNFTEKSKEPNVMAAAQRFEELKDKILYQLTAVNEYRFRHYEFGADWNA